MISRTFYSDDVVRRWLARQNDPAGVNVAIVDQIKAATAETERNFWRTAPWLVASGIMAGAGWSKEKEGFVLPARMLLATNSAGPEICPHTARNGASPRPLIMHCDPPVVCCLPCARSMLNKAKKLGHRWPHECDGCGSKAEIVRPVSIGLGYITVAGHICNACHERQQVLQEIRMTRP